MPTTSDWGLREPYQAYTFGDLPKVRDYQLQQLRSKGVAAPNNWPQAMLAATEQGWGTANADQQSECACWSQGCTSRMAQPLYL